MAKIEIILPKMGESVAEATITSWKIKVGDIIEEEQTIVEIATDKVDSEVPSPASGKILELIYNEGDIVKVGEIIAVVENNVNSAEDNTTNSTMLQVEENKNNKIDSETNNINQSNFEVYKNSNNFYSPLVKSIAKKENISIEQLNTITGTGQNNRVTKNDLLNYISNNNVEAINNSETQAKNSNKSPNSSTTPIISSSQNETNDKLTTSDNRQEKSSNINLGANDEIIEMDRMRKLIADHMVNSKHTSPHVTSFVEADVTNIVQWRGKVKNEFLTKEGENITFTPIFMEAIVKAIKDFPMINISVSGDKIIKKGNINLGMATALPSGNLIVPVIKNADRLNLVGLTKSVNELANKARNNKLSPDDIQGGTYTVTNVGTFGNVMGTPIINQPQVAILALGAIRKVPAVIETKDGDFIGIRHKMFLSHSYDHRVVDGALGGMFVRKVADYLENFDVNRDI